MVKAVINSEQVLADATIDATEGHSQIVSLQEGQKQSHGRNAFAAFVLSDDLSYVSNCVRNLVNLVWPLANLGSLFFSIFSTAVFSVGYSVVYN